MFGDSEFEAEVAAELLSLFDFMEVLEMNDLSEQDVLEILIGGGYVTQPERFFPED